MKRDEFINLLRNIVLNAMEIISLLEQQLQFYITSNTNKRFWVQYRPSKQQYNLVEING